MADGRAHPHPAVGAGLTERAAGQSVVHGPLLRLERALDAVFTSWAHDDGADEYRFPAFIEARHLQRLDYFHSFPHLVTFPVALDDAAANIELFRQTGAPGRDGVVHLTERAPVQHVVTPAACYHIYVELEGQTLEKPRVVTTRNTCCRRESHYVSLERQWTFSMREIVCIGTADEVERFLAAAAARLTRFVERLGLPVAWEGATDPFFNPTKNPKFLFQKLEPVKRELVFDERLAIASTNFHRDYFGEAFKMTRPDADGNAKALCSGCIAFGIERWLSAIVHTHGSDPRAWPNVEEAARG